MAIDSNALVLAKTINKKLKMDAVVVASSIQHSLMPRITSGSVSLDYALGGGWPGNQWVELIGEASSGKTMTALKTIAANQAKNPDHTTVWVAAEQWVPGYAQMCGVDLDQVLVIETNIMEEAYQAVIQFAESQTVDAIVIDSLPALVPSIEDEKDAGDSTVGRTALLTNQFFRKVGKAMKRSLVEEERPVLGLMINQWRQQIGVMHGDNRTTPGGKGKDFAYFVRCEVRRGDWLTHGTGDRATRVGQTVKVRIIKNKTAPPQQVANIDFYYDDCPPLFKAGDTDFAKEIVALAILNDILTRSGAWYYYQDRKWQGADSVLDSVREEPDLAAQITSEVMEVVTRAAQ
jgi:recombination protein RecA